MGIKIEIYNTNLVLSCKEWEFLHEIDLKFSLPIAGYCFTKAYKLGKGDGKVHFFNVRYRTLLTGLLDKLISFLEERGIAYEIEDRRRLPKLNPQKFVDVSFRDFQKESIEKALIKGRGIIQASTGSGKTEIAVGIIATLGFPKTLFLVPSLSLFYQTYERFLSRLGLKEGEVGQIGDSIWEVKDITVATVQTLSQVISNKNRDKDISFLSEVELVLIDECHFAGADSYKIVMKELSNCYWRYALSATAFTGNDIRDYYVMGYFGDIIIDIVKEYKKPVIWMVDYNFTADKELKYSEAYVEYIINNEKRNRWIKFFAEKLSNEGRKVIILVKQVRHGEKLEKLISNAILIQGKDNKTTRDMKVKDFLANNKILIATTCFLYGVDLPEISGVILGGAWESKIATFQGIGRGMRESKFKDLIVVDFIERKKKGSRKNYLSNHSKKRLAYYKERGYEVKELFVDNITGVRDFYA